MTTRRQLLTALSSGTAATFLAGCISSEDDSGDGSTLTPTPTPTPTATPTQTESPTDTPTDTPVQVAEFSLSPSVPDEVNVGEEFTYGFTVTNTGGAEGLVTVGIDLSVVGESGWESIGSVDFELEPGESETFTSDEFTLDDAVTVQWEFWAIGGHTDTVVGRATDVIQPTYVFGDPFRTPTDLEITPTNLRLRDSYTYEDYLGDRQVHEAPPGEQFAFVDNAVLNDSDGTRETPNRLSFEIVAGATQTDPMSRLDYEREDGYDGLNTIVPDVVEDGVLPYQIPADTTTDGIQLFHQEYDFERDAEWQVTWQTE